MSSVITTVLEVVGLVAVSAAAALTDYRLGLLVAGVSLVAVGFLLERR